MGAGHGTHWICLGLALQFGLMTSTLANADEAQMLPLIPRKTLFGNPDRVSPALSHDGARIGFLAPVEGVLNVWVAPTGDLAAAKPVTQDKGRGIRFFFWAYDNQHLLYLQDQKGDENWRLHSVDLTSGETKELTPETNVNVQVEQLSPKFPAEILVGLNLRNPQLHDVFRVNIATGERKLVQENPGFEGFVADDDFNVRFARRFEPDGGAGVFAPDGQGSWKPFFKIPMEDTLTTNIVGFDKTGKTLYATDSRNRNTAALVTIDVATGKEDVVFANDKADVSNVLVHPSEKTLQAVGYEYDRERWQVLDPQIKGDFDALSALETGALTILDRTLDDRRWVVAYLQDAGPTRYYLWDRDAKQARFLFTNRKGLEELKLAAMTPVIIPARDGLELVCYLSLPPNVAPAGGRPAQPLPMVLVVHGGPWARDSWGYDPIHQLLANRGYAVLSVNFRGSTGFGKAFLNAGNKEWGAKMQDDLVDAVQWAIAQKIADPSRVAIMGGSYGGYATLVGLTRDPGLFACGVDIVGPSNLQTLLESAPPYWKPFLQVFKDRVGDHETPEGKAFLQSRSPLTNVGAISKPLLIGQGANDPRVKQAESDQIVHALQAKKIAVTYVLFPDEGHGFARPENRFAFYAIADVFLAAHLGGRSEPLKPEDFQGSSIQAPAGADQVAGLPALLMGK